MFAKISLIIFSLLFLATPIQSSEGGAGIIIFLAPIILIPPVTGAIAAEYTFNESDEYFHKSWITNFVLSAYSAGLIKHITGKSDAFKDATHIIGYGSWVLLPGVYSYIFNNTQISVEPMILANAYGTNNNGIGLEFGYKKVYVTYGMGSFGDKSVGAKDEVFTETVDFFSIKYEIYSNGRHTLYPETYYKYADIFYSKNYKTVAEASIHFLGLGFQYEYYLLDLFPLHLHIANEFALAGTQTFYDTAERSPLLNMTGGISVGYCI